MNDEHFRSLSHHEEILGSIEQGSTGLDTAVATRWILIYSDDGPLVHFEKLENLTDAQASDFVSCSVTI